MTFKVSDKLSNLSDIKDKFNWGEISKLFKREDNPLLLIHRDMKSISDRTAKYDLIITPQLYMMKIDSLPIKYGFQAKKIAPSILDEFSRGKEFDYQVFREEKPQEKDEGDIESENIYNWTFLGYSREDIEEILIDRGFTSENIGKIYFAQQFKEQLDGKLLLMSQKEALTVINGIVTIVPRNFIDNKNIIFLENLERPERSFSFRLNSRSKSNIDKKLAIKLAIAFGLFGLGFWLDGTKSDNQITKLDERLSEQFSKYPSLQSSITRKNIYSKYSKIDREQRGVREFLKMVGKLISRDAKVEALEVNSKNLQATISVKNGKISKLKSIAKNAGLKISTRGNSTLIVTKAK